MAYRSFAQEEEEEIHYIHTAQGHVHPRHRLGR